MNWLQIAGAPPFRGVVAPDALSAISFYESNWPITEITSYRQLPCRTFISIGACPFRERCDYLHDPRCFGTNNKSKTRRKKEEDTSLDSFFWPNIPLSRLRRRHDGQPIVVQNYVVPLPNPHDDYYLHDRALYSMWNFFVDFCASNSRGELSTDDKSVTNRHTGRPRLPIFILLSSMSDYKDS